MAAGQGFKTFTTGEVLTAGDVNGYLMQGINVFADATARDAAITAPAEGQFAFTKDNNSLWYYDGAAWVASGATGDIEGVTVTSPLTGGGTSGTVTVGIQEASTSQRGSVQLSDSTSTTSSTLAATSTAVKSSYDLANAAIAKSIVDAKGDLIGATAADTVSRLAVGANGTVLTADSSTATGLKWASAAAAAQNFALISSVSLSTGTTTISGISGKNQLMIYVNQASSTSSGAFLLRFNSDSGTNYTYFFLEKAGTGAVAFSTSTDDNQIQVGNAASGNNLNMILTVQGTNAAGYKPGTWTAYAPASSGNTSASGNFFYKGSSTISSVSLICQAGTFDAGTIAVYGA